MLTVAVCVSICLFLSVYLGKGGRIAAAFGAVPPAVFTSFFFARLIHWYCYAESYSGFAAAMGDFSRGGFALIGAFAGCALSVGVLYLMRILEDPARMLDCMCLAGGAGIAIGRLMCFFGAEDRGQILGTVRSFPWASPVINAVSKSVEYRLATFLLQSMVTGGLTLVLAGLYFGGRGRKWKDGEVSLIFLLCYCAAQVVLDSTRYDSMYFRSNGFISVVQVFGAVAVVLIGILFSVRLVKTRGFRPGYILLWVLMAGLLGCAGYMEYYVQRHGNQAVLAYSIMSAALVCFAVLALGIRAAAGRKNCVS